MSATDSTASFEWWCVMGLMEPAPGGSATSNRDALQELYRQELRGVYAFLMARCGDCELAEDLTSETFVAAAHLFADGHGNEVTGSWLLTVARRRLIDHWRRQTILQDRVARLRRQREPENHTAGPDAHVHAALASLGSRQRAAVMLRYLDRYSVSEVAQTLECSYRSAESLLGRGRRAFRKAYLEVCDE